MASRQLKPELAAGLQVKRVNTSDRDEETLIYV
jgi:hypothetical protein